ncbi:MAG: right-handed parallel beta-helix repeat-containing protein [Pseudomonadota bacterium]|nr:MAG: right-handed parallel beta-helix repeat-containing protein [Pseudomonadota bacterium]
MRFQQITCLAGILLFGNVTAAELFVSAGGVGLSCTQPDPCGSIQMAVDVASSGDRIHVGPGTYVENVRLGTPQAPNTKPNITITGAGSKKTNVESAGGVGERPPTVPADIIFDIWSADVTIEKLTMVHPAGAPTKRDIGVFVGPPAVNAVLSKCEIARERTGNNLEPWQPGSRGILVFRATGSLVSKNLFRGNYEDHIHMPTSESEISKNDVTGATRLGIVIIQESANSFSVDNLVVKNNVSNSGSDAIQIQGDDNLVVKNKVANNGGAGIKLCGIDEVGDCVAPFDAWSEASDNTVSKNKATNNALGAVVDNGSDNIVD